MTGVKMMGSGDNRERWTDMRMKHLEMIQGVILRMANNSASMKGLCITLVSATMAVGATTNQPLIALLAMMIALLFSVMDCFYLVLERRYRKLYDEVRRETEVLPDFRMDVSGRFQEGEAWQAYRSRSIAGMYLPVAVVSGLTAAFI